MNVPDKIKSYLNKKASNQWKIENDYDKLFKKIIVVPAIAEYKNIPALIKSLEQNNEEEFADTLLMVVVNNTTSSLPEIKDDNTATLNYLRNLKSKVNISFVDASSAEKEMDDKNGGVGLARKIGMDIALTIFDYSTLQKNILVCLDADCILNKYYLSAITKEFNENNYDAAVVNFAHDISGDDEETKAIICYEIFLRYYVCGLKFANPDYAFHTIGSTMMCTPEAYVKVEGMNKRKAAEDFYFLEKLAKVYKVGKIKTTTIQPSKRSSWRVPFGTGRSVERFLKDAKNEYSLYNPQSFVVLKKWLEIFLAKDKTEYSLLIKNAQQINPHLADFLINNKLKEFLAATIKDNTNPNEIKKQKHFWFDAFKTLKLIHYLRDACYPNINMFDAIDTLLDMMEIENNIIRNEIIPEISVQKNYLTLLRNLQS